MLVRVCALVAFLTLAAASPLAALRPDHDIEEILSLTGTREELLQNREELLGHFTPMKKDMPPSFAAVYDSLATALLHPDTLYYYARQQWYVRYDTVRGARALAWLRSPAGKAVLAGERKAWAPAAARTIAQLAKKSATDSKLRRQVEPFEREIDNSAQARAELVIVLARQLIRLANTLPSSDPMLTDADIGALVEEMRPDLLDYYRTLARGTYAYAFRTVTDAQRKEYSTFIAGEDGTWFAQERRYAIVQAYHIAGLRFIVQLRAAFDSLARHAAQDPSTIAYVNSVLKKGGENSRIIGVMEATANGREWMAYLNVERNPDRTLTLLALNSDLVPQEQMEVTFNFKGKGTYAISPKFAVLFRLDDQRTPVERFESGGPDDQVVITSYDEQAGMIEGNLRVLLLSPTGARIDIVSKPFIARIKE